MGEYVGRIYDETRERPKYIIESRYGFDPEHSSEARGARSGDGSDAAQY
jgi:hypothetical protein